MSGQSPGVIDLFAGPGGWDQGLAMLGRRDVVGVEWDGPACETARAAGHARVQADVAELDPAAFAAEQGWTGEGLIASPPCQGFSMAGKGKGRGDTPLVLAGVEQVGAGRDIDKMLARLRHRVADHRTALVLEPLRWALALRPGWMAWEQVPAVLPLWEACADVLRSVGYDVATGNVQAEQYGVPQTRKRAILVARLGGPVALPVPTHSRYHSRTPEKLDPGVAKWVSMAEALSWGATARPAMTVTGGGTAAGGAEPFGNAARRGLQREAAAGRWVFKGGPMENGTVRDLDSPAPTIHSQRSANMQWLFAGAGATSQVTAGQVPRGLDQPAHTITGKGTTAWLPQWTHERPATTVQGDSRIWPPGHKVNADDRRRLGDEADERYGDRAGTHSVRVTVAEAAVLQSFPADYPFAGNKGQCYRQVGDAVPPLLAAHILQAVGAGVLPVGASDPERAA